MAINFGYANPYNVFVINDHTQNDTDSEGLVFVGGNATYSNYSVASNYPVAINYNSLIVIRDIDINSGTNFAANTGKSSLSNVLNYTMTNNNGVPDQPILLDNTFIQLAIIEEAYLKCASLGWSNFKNNGIGWVQFGGLILLGISDELNIFTIDGTNVQASGLTLAQLNRINIIAPIGSTILINVLGTPIGFGSKTIFRNGVSATGNDAQYILWNLPDCLEIESGTTSIKGSILAPYATYNSTFSNFEGTLMVYNFYGNAEAHDYLFLGELPDVCQLQPLPPSNLIHQAITDLIESIALEQTSLSHILNSEGEKIQKALELNLDAEELLAINKSVKCMINSIGLLESVLVSKLDTVICMEDE